MPIPPAPPLDETIVAGQSGHISDHDAIHSALNNDTMSLAGAQTVAGAKTFNAGTFLDKGSLVFNVKAYGAVGDGVADDNAEVQAAIDAAEAAGGGDVFVPLGIYNVLDLAGAPGVSFSGYGTLRKNGGAASTHILNLAGSETATSPALSSNAAIGDATVAVASASGLAVDDYVLLRDSTYVTGSVGRNQELNRIAGISGTTITLANRLIGAYATASSAELVVITPIADVSVTGLKFDIPVGTAGGNIYLDLCYGVDIAGVTALRPNDDAGIHVERSCEVLIDGCRVRDGQNQASPGFGYGISVQESSHHITVRGNDIENVRECLFTDRVRHSKFVDNTIRDTYDSAFNTHGSGNQHILIADNVISACRANGISVGFTTHTAADRDIVIRNNVLSYIGAKGISVDAPVSGLLNNERISISGNHIYSFGMGATQSYGVFASRTDNVTINNNEMDGAGNTNAYKGVYVANVTAAKIKANAVDGMTSAGQGIGIQAENSTTVTIRGNDIGTCASNYIRSAIGNTGIIVEDNVSAGTSFNLTSGVIRRRGNVWGSSYDNNQGGAAAVTDGATITHGLVASPTNVRATATESGEFVSVTATNSTTFTVAIKKHDGTAGTSQTVYWEASVA